jgi:HlyD family secretion protein
MVPAAAVKSDGGVFKLFIAKGDRAEARLVQVGREAAGRLEILRGLAAGERVVSPHVPGLADGALIAAAQEAK